LREARALGKILSKFQGMREGISSPRYSDSFLDSPGARVNMSDISKLEITSHSLSELQEILIYGFLFLSTDIAIFYWDVFVAQHKCTTLK
jgi:hypothetical protein